MMAGPGAFVKRRAPASADREIHEIARDRMFTKGRACVDPQGRQLCLRQYYRNGSMRGMRNFEFHEKLSMQVQRRDDRHRIIRNASDSKPPVSAEVPPVFRTSANHNAHEVSASLTGLSKKKRDRAISIIAVPGAFECRRGNTWPVSRNRSNLRDAQGTFATNLEPDH